MWVGKEKKENSNEALSETSSFKSDEDIPKGINLENELEKTEESKDENEGVGLGIKFLKHIERCKILLHMIDVSENDLVLTYKQIRNELKKYLYPMQIFLHQASAASRSQ